jgi:hypothetical protein
MPNEDEEWQETKLQFRAIGERLLTAGWATTIFDAQGGMRIEWTPKGVECVKNLRNTLAELSPSTMQNEHFAGLILHILSADDSEFPFLS